MKTYPINRREEWDTMNRQFLPYMLMLLLLLSGITGCLDDEGSDDDDDVPSSISAPTWEPGKFWVYAFTTPDETDVASRLVVGPDSDDGVNHQIGTADPMEARRHAVLNYDPLLGRVEKTNFSVYENGEPQPLFQFPLKKGNTWSFSFLGVENWEVRVESIERTFIPATGDTIIVDIHAEAPGGEVMDYSFDVSAGWVHLIRAWDPSGTMIVNMTLVSHGTGYSGQIHFMRGLNLFDESYSSSPGSPVVEAYDTYLDSGHPSHGDFDTLVIYLNIHIGESSGGSLSIKDHTSNEAFIRSFSTSEDTNELHEIEDQAGEYSVTVNLDGSCELRVRIAGGIMYTWDV